jgi:uncharacterized protein (DUF433 family)
MDLSNYLIALTLSGLLGSIADAMKYLEARPDRASGELTIKGTRIRIAQVINMLAHGFTLNELHTEHFPHVSIRTLRGAVEEATQSLPVQTHA